MSKIPIKKLRNGSQNYYPLSVGESVVLTHPITVEHDIGELKTGDIVEELTSFDTLFSKILQGTGGGSGGTTFTVDDTLIYNTDTKILKVNTDKIQKKFSTDDTLTKTDSEILSVNTEKIQSKLSNDNTIKIINDTISVDTDVIATRQYVNDSMTQVFKYKGEAKSVSEDQKTIIIDDDTSISASRSNVGHLYIIFNQNNRNRKEYVSDGKIWELIGFSSNDFTDDYKEKVDHSVQYVKSLSNNFDAVSIGTRASGSDIGTRSIVCGDQNAASSNSSVSFGLTNKALGKASLCEGSQNETGAIKYSNQNNYSVGTFVCSSDNAIFKCLKANGKTDVHVPPSGVGTSDDYWFYIGDNGYQHSEGSVNKSIGESAHTEGTLNTVSGNYSHAEGSNNVVNGRSSHAEGNGNTVNGDYSHSEGYTCTSKGDASHSEGSNSNANELYSHAEGYYCDSNGKASHSEGHATTAYSDYSHAEGDMTNAKSPASHTEGISTTTNGIYSHAEGQKTITNSLASHAEGVSNITGFDSFVINKTYHTGDKCSLTFSNSGTIYCLTFKCLQECTGKNPLTETEYWSQFEFNQGQHSEGYNTKALGEGSHSEGSNTIAHSKYCHVQGRFNIEDKEAKFADIVGNGTKDSERKNISTLTWTGVQWTSNDVTCGGINDQPLHSLTNKVDKVNGKDLSTNDYTTEEKTKLESLENYDDTEVKSGITENHNAIFTTGNKETCDGSTGSLNNVQWFMLGSKEKSKIFSTKTTQISIKSAPTLSSEVTGTYKLVVWINDGGDHNNDHNKVLAVSTNSIELVAGTENYNTWNFRGFVIPDNNKNRLLVTIAPSSYTDEELLSHKWLDSARPKVKVLPVSYSTISGDDGNQIFTTGSNPQWGKIVSLIATVEVSKIDNKVDKGSIKSMSSKAFWSGTQSEYDALTTKDPDTLYFIVGD